MTSKTPEAWIDFLLTCMDCTDGKVNWEQVAQRTGWYKSGKFSRQAYDGVKKKYAGMVIGNNTGSQPATPKTKATLQTPKAPKTPKTPKRGMDETIEPNSSHKKHKKSSATTNVLKQEENSSGTENESN